MDLLADGHRSFTFMVYTNRVLKSQIIQNSNLNPILENNSKGFIGLVWFILFMTLTSNSPQTHKFISEKEKAYILANTNSEEKISQTKIKV